MNLCHPRWLLTIWALLVLAVTSTQAQEAAEAKRLRVLIAVDTHDRMGVAWGIDGMNMKAVLQGTLQKQNLAERTEIEMFTGTQVTPENILGYFHKLQADPEDALVFYYSGHGGYHLKRGHFMALHYGELYRADLIKAMKKPNPRLVVVLTDCCANFAGGARAEEPKGTVLTPKVNVSPAGPKAKRQEPPNHKIVRSKEARPRTVPRPDLKFEKDNQGKEMVLQTGAGPLPLKSVLQQTDGVAMRHLLFRHQGIVDINGCAKGAFSMGTPQWGGSLFTIGLIELQRDRLAKFDKNGNRLIEWSEFFPHLREATRKASQRLAPGAMVQTPEAVQLGQPANN